MYSIESWNKFIIFQHGIKVPRAYLSSLRFFFFPSDGSLNLHPDFCNHFSYIHILIQFSFLSSSLHHIFINYPSQLHKFLFRYSSSFSYLPTVFMTTLFKLPHFITRIIHLDRMNYAYWLSRSPRRLERMTSSLFCSLLLLLFQN